MSLPRRSLKAFACLIGISLLYAVTFDSIVRPPLRTMTDVDFDDAEGSIIPAAPTNTTVLIVSAMFPLAKAKHSKADYRLWMEHFLGQITTDIYMYTTPELADFVRTIRGDLPIIVDTTYTSPFEVLPLVDLEEIYTRMNDLDKEKWHRSPELYAVWNAKPYLLDTAVKKLAVTGKNYTYTFWNDGGSFRNNHYYGDWPSAARVDQIWAEGSSLTGTNAKDLLFFPVFKQLSNEFSTWAEKMGPIANPLQVSEGSFFGGSPSTVEWYSKVFYTYHNYYLARGYFVGIDQDIFNALALLYPQRLFTVWFYDPKSRAHTGIIPSPSLIAHVETGFLGECGDEWFYYQFWLANREARDMMRETWITEERWRLSGWWQERKLCRLTKAMSMMDFLRVSFGESWIPPMRTISIPGLDS